MGPARRRPIPNRRRTGWRGTWISSQAPSAGQADSLPGAETARDAQRGGAHGEPEAARLRAVLREQDAERGHRRVVLAENRRGYRHDDLLFLAPVDGQLLAAHLG